MAFNTQEQEIIKYGLQNGKSKQEVEQAISNYRAGIVPTPKVIIQPEQTSGVVDGVSRVASTYVKNLKEQVVGGINYGGEGLATQSENYWQAVQSGNKLDQTKALLRGGLRVAGGEAQALLSPITAAISTGIQGWQELDKATGGTVTNQIKDIAQKNPEIISGISNYIAQNPEKVKDVQDLLNFIGGGVVSTESKALKTGLQDITTGIKDTLTRTPKTIDGIPISKVSTKTAIKGSAYDLINSSSGDLTQKAVDFISNDPGAKVETILKRSTPQELDNYLAIAQQHASSQESKHVFEVVGDKLSDTTKFLDTKLKEIGKAKSDIVTPLREGLGAFKKETTPLIEKLTSLKNNFSEVDKGQKATVQAIINDAKTVATKRDADMFIDKVQNALYTGNMDMTIPSGSSLDKQLRGILGDYNTSLKKSLPIEYTQLNEQYAKLVEALSTINKSLGDTFEGVPLRGSGLIKQFFSPAGSKAKEIFEFIKKETNGEVDLAKDATLAKFAGQLYDDPNVNSLLGGIKDIPTTATAVVGKVIEKVGGKQITDALRSSTVRKAKSSTIQGSAQTTYSPTTQELKEVLSPSTNSTSQAVKSKGIRGMVNVSEMLPKKNQLRDTYGRFTKKEYDLSIDNAINSSFTPEDLQSFLTLKRQFSNKKLSTVNFEIVREDLANLLQKYGLFKYEGKLTPADNEIIDYISKKALQASEKAKIRTSENMNQFLKNR